MMLRVNDAGTRPMLIGGIALGLILGLLAGGSIINLASSGSTGSPLLFVAVIVRFGTEFLLNADVPLAEALRVPLLGDVVRAPARRPVGEPRLPGHEPRVHRGPGQRHRHPGQRRLHADLDLPSLAARRVSTRPTSRPALHTILPPALDANFLLHLGPFADVIPIPFPIIQNVASIGDVFLTLGLAFFLFAAVVRVPQELDEAELARDPRRASTTWPPPAARSAPAIRAPRPACRRP